MSCNFPIWCVDLGRQYNARTKSFNKHNILYNVAPTSASQNEVYNMIHKKYSDFQKIFQVPCGKCLGCRLDYGKQWADRCILESQYHDSNYFITLTYDNDNIPKKLIYTPYDNLKTHIHGNLCLKDLQLFIKSLRKNTGQKIRYVASGEYGSKTLRPHYHMIIFGLKLDDLVIHQKTTNGIYYTSKTISDIWNKGFCIISGFSYETASYVARYTMKKAYKDSNFTDNLGLRKEFIVMSRRPGIGYQYYRDNKEQIYKYDKIIVNRKDNSFMSRPPRYFDKQLAKDNIELLENIKDIRDNSINIIKPDTDLSYDEYNNVKALELVNKTKILKERRSL